MHFLHITPNHSTLPLCVAAFYLPNIKSAPPETKDETGPLRKDDTMTLSHLAAKITAWLRYRASMRELSSLSDLGLKDLGISRSDIEFISRQTVRT